MMMSSSPSSASDRQPGRPLSRKWYSSPDIFARDIERFFHRHWIFAAPLAAFKIGGDYITLDVGGAPLFLLRGEDDVIRAFHNVCRHRGSRLLSSPHGNLGGKKIICPYHQWAYKTDGELSRASHVLEQPDAKSYSLFSLRCAVLGGGVYVCLRADAQMEKEMVFAQTQITGHLSGYSCAHHKIAFQSTHIVDANWKLAVENNRECGHCRGAHPELMSCVFDFGMGADARNNAAYLAAEKTMENACKEADVSYPALDFPEDSFFRLARLPYRGGFCSETTDGKPACQKPLGDIPAAAGQLRLVTLPNCWSHYLSDYCVITRLLPLAPQKTRLDVFWMVHESAREGKDYHLQQLTEVWEQTTVQDSRLIGENQAGVNSPAYQPGYYSPVTETLVEHFADWYCRRISAVA